MRDIKNIFVVDDDEIMLFGMRKMLTNIAPKSNIYEFSNGQVALKAILERAENNKALPEVIFLDINMPILDGWEFLKEFTKLAIPQKILINIITSSIDPIDREKWVNFRKKTHHYIGFVNKPIYKIELKDLYKMDMAS